ncbi:alpha/beta hydrolase fold-3 domain-containing protein [Verticillium alfalfae VaMs.102]|uniref:Alpha/beta hydrolase fold-3 domain-containing protein n=1 Tax=Verticillium alfalfae (strain VaMs.102 / ATCC MYA-4576 / FGSC 10136) TaxID=526221 RepID=C9SN45_VERA1|nr:alpha/beta hydrolase fold-3 domain-containing protein [Verticillium alfalfae VaMs.102]EEY20210.1 alpha/beta hydrolase fold-3 domain-containing protein [Verticillium alfalfae VaMs.102]
MKQDDIQPPRVTSGPGYPEAFAIQLETELSALRESIARQSSDGHLFDNRVTVDTPGLGEGHVKCSVCLPKAPVRTPEFPAPLSLIILLEGGGFALGQPSDGEANAKFMSDKLNAIVVSLDYAKAPRYPFPHALLQAYDVLKWSISPAAERTLGVAADPSRVTVVGCSAGGNLATSLSLLVAFTAGPAAPFRAALDPHFRQVAQVLVYPCLALHERYGERFARASPEAQAKSIPVVMLEKMEAATRCPGSRSH